MATLNDIKSPINNEIRQFESFFNNTIKSDVPLLKIIINYLLRRKGKQMRPLLVLLSASINGKINESTYVAATLIELLHTASLVHDDVVDNADERRGAPSIKALWNSKIAVLIGDYLLAQGLLISVRNERYDMLEIVSEAVQKMAEAEIMQIQKVRKYSIKEDDYFKIISGKTAALISACTATGTRSTTDDITIISQMKEMGNYIGIAFQIRDDLFDYSAYNTGKKACNDIVEGKITLPLIHSLEYSSFSERQRIIPIIKNHSKSKDDIQKIVDFVNSHDGILYAEKKMIEYKEKALELIETYPQSEYKTSLIAFVDYTTSREK